MLEMSDVIRMMPSKIPRSGAMRMRGLHSARLQRARELRISESDRGEQCRFLARIESIRLFHSFLPGTALGTGHG